MKCHEAVKIADKEEWTTAEAHALILHVKACAPCRTFYDRLYQRDLLMPASLQAKYIQQGIELRNKMAADPETQA